MMDKPSSNLWVNSQATGDHGELKQPRPDPSCPNCGGSGTRRFAQKVHYDRSTFPPSLVIDEETPIPFGLTPFEFRVKYASMGYREAARNCDCLQASLKARRNARLGRAEMPDDVDNFTLEDFKIYPAAYEFARMLIAGEPLVDDQGVERPGLMFVGPYGGGKSVLSGIIHDGVMAAGLDSIWLKLVTMVKRFQETYSPRYVGPPLAELIDQLCMVPLLVIDELGNRNEAMNGLQLSRDRTENLLRVIDYRAAHKKPLVLTSNLDVDLLYSHIDPAIASRVRGSCHVVLMDNGIDFRTGEPTR